MRKLALLLFIFCVTTAHAQFKYPELRQRESQYFAGFFTQCNCIGYATGIEIVSDSTFRYSLTVGVKYETVENKMDSLKQKWKLLLPDLQNNIIANDMKYCRGIEITYSTDNEKKPFITVGKKL